MNITVLPEETETKMPTAMNHKNESRNMFLPIAILIGMGFTIQLIIVLVRCWKRRQVAKNQGGTPISKPEKQRNGRGKASKDSNPLVGLYFDDGPPRVAENINYSDFYYGPANFGLDMDELIEERRKMTGPIFNFKENSDSESEDEPQLGEGEQNYNYEHVEMLTCL